MNFDYKDEILKIFDKLQADVDKIISNRSSDQISIDVSWEIGDAIDSMVKLVNGEIVDDVVYQMDDLNSMDEEELMDAIKRDKMVYKYIINRTEDMKNLYFFLYEL